MDPDLKQIIPDPDKGKSSGFNLNRIQNTAKNDGKIISVELDISNNKAVILIYNFLMLLFGNRQKIS